MTRYSLTTGSLLRLKVELSLNESGLGMMVLAGITRFVQAYDEQKKQRQYLSFLLNHLLPAHLWSPMPWFFSNWAALICKKSFSKLATFRRDFLLDSESFQFVALAQLAAQVYISPKPFYRAGKPNCGSGIIPGNCHWFICLIIKLRLNLSSSNRRSGCRSVNWLSQRFTCSWPTWHSPRRTGIKCFSASTFSASSWAILPSASQTRAFFGWKFATAYCVAMNITAFSTAGWTCLCFSLAKAWMPNYNYWSNLIKLSNYPGYWNLGCPSSKARFCLQCGQEAGDRGETAITRPVIF